MVSAHSEMYALMNFGKEIFMEASKYKVAGHLMEWYISMTNSLTVMKLVEIAYIQPCRSSKENSAVAVCNMHESKNDIKLIVGLQTNTASIHPSVSVTAYSFGLI
jgi:hypothetical protein